MLPQSGVFASRYPCHWQRERYASGLTAKRSRVVEAMAILPCCIHRTGGQSEDGAEAGRRLPGPDSWTCALLCAGCSTEKKKYRHEFADLNQRHSCQPQRRTQWRFVGRSVYFHYAMRCDAQTDTVLAHRGARRRLSRMVGRRMARSRSRSERSQRAKRRS